MAIEQARAFALLNAVKTVSETERNPHWGDNQVRMRGPSGRTCNSACSAADIHELGDRKKVKADLERLAKEGHLEKLTKAPGGNFQFFRPTDAGLAFLAQHNTK